MQIVLLTPTDCRWDEAVTFVRAVFRKTHAAHVAALPPRLFVAIGHDDRIVGAAGVRTASDGFFSDCYLDRPLELELAATSGRDVGADDIIEVVSTACINPIAAPAILDAIAVWGRAKGCSWGVFTATRAIRAMFKRSGKPLIKLTAARPDCIADPESWGSYYATDPWVCAMPDAEAAPVRFRPTRPSQGDGAQCVA